MDNKDYINAYTNWLKNDYFDENTKDELRKIVDDPKEIEDRFYKSLEFGTGGLRGIIGAGDNRMNIYTVRKATQGLANYILNNDPANAAKGVALAYDSRRMSIEFADAAALVLCGNGIKAYVFDELRPTPLLSFAVRHLGCVAGIVVTASHNPPEYNGYKVYWEDGGQVPFPMDGEIIAEVNKITDYSQIRTISREKSVNAGLYCTIGAEIDDEYIKRLKEQIIDRSVIDCMADNLNIVYTPLHGTGNKPVMRILREAGFNHVTVVPEQELPDSEFSTIDYPNPEDKRAFKLALELADRVGADLAIATDPDADRVGVAVRKPDGSFALMTGNMTGVMLEEYILSRKKPLPENAVIISTIVSTRMAAEIAARNNAKYIDVLTGFKYIGEKIKQFEEDAGTGTFLFGFEESYGSLAGTHARDKDAVVSTLLICEMAAYYKSRGMTLYDGLSELYEKYGYFKESIESIALTGIEGVESIRKIMHGLRTNPPSQAAGAKITEIRDYKTAVVKNTVTGYESATGLPVSDVLYFTLEDDSWFCIRPSGTEPKIKIYFGVKAGDGDEANRKLERLTKEAMDIVRGQA